MLLPQKKEREYRFKLSLRMGLPIFGLILVLISTTLVNNYQNLTLSFYIESTLLLLVSVYFIFYLIYRGFDVAITDSVSKVFTREYIYNYLKQKIKTNKTYTILLIGIDNIADINSSYGIKNGDKVLKIFSKWVGDFLTEKEVYNFPIGRIRAGDFIIGLEGNSYENKTLLDLLLLKSQEIKLQNIELKISGALVDTSISKNLDNLIDLLFEQKECEKCKDLEVINPEEKERLVIEAIKEKSISIASQKVFNKANNEVFGELFIRLKTKENNFIHQKKYIKVLNKLGLTLDFDIMTVEKVLLNIERLNVEKVVLNISSTSLRNLTFFNKVKELFDKNEELKDRVIFIFSENEYYPNKEKFNFILSSFKKLGVSIAVDRLGSLHSSFLYLKDLDIDIVRFDSSYTKNDKIFKNKDILKGFTCITKAKGIKSWVKMIEDTNQLEITKDLEIDYIQGKIFSELMEENV